MVPERAADREGGLENGVIHSRRGQTCGQDLYGGSLGRVVAGAIDGLPIYCSAVEAVSLTGARTMGKQARGKALGRSSCVQEEQRRLGELEFEKHR